MEVKLLSTPNHDESLNLIYAACRQCYEKGFVGNIDLSKVPNDKKVKLIKKVFNSGHHSTLEHVVFSFAIENISRACANQLVRHRLASMSQQSQRFCDSSAMPIVVPESFLKNKDAAQDLIALAQVSSNLYNKYKERGIPKEDLRAFLLLCTGTNIVVTMNVRELIHFFGLRLCSKAQREIREMARKMLELCKKVLPEIFEVIGPKCKQLGYCNEGDRSCGVMPLKEDIFDHVEELQFRKRAEKNAPILNQKFSEIFEEMKKEGGDNF